MPLFIRLYPPIELIDEAPKNDLDNSVRSLNSIRRYHLIAAVIDYY